ncbi:MULTISPECIES: RpnC/YadD family protein [Bacillus cereus group]|uniref:hypothetical protein n=1 Tax=Bacillus cereus group TaxID=86661 RepID=UPI0011A5A44A|nr:MULTISPECIES: hypothetical protein [Bacillus cereus group]MCB5895950.1 hypothetical protein [Bacillus cereus]
MQSEKVKMDQIMKLLFSCTNEMIIPIINSFFKTKYTVENTQIEHSNNEFITENLEVIRSDEYLCITHDGHKKLYHIEFQTKKDKRMLPRMFEYGMAKCYEVFQNERQKKIPEFPQQLVMFLEKDETIPTSMDFKFLLSDEEVTYSVNVERYWDWEMENLVKEKLYGLIPLQLFNHRRDIAKLCRNEKSTENEIQDEVNKIKATAEKCGKALIQAYEDKFFNTDDLEKVLRVVSYFTKFLYNMYNKKVTEEVDEMIKTLWNPTQIEKGQVDITREHILEFLYNLNDEEPISKHVTDLINKQENLSTLNYWFSLAIKSKTVSEFYSKIKGK